MAVRAVIDQIPDSGPLGTGRRNHCYIKTRQADTDRAPSRHVGVWSRVPGDREVIVIISVRVSMSLEDLVWLVFIVLLVGCMIAAA
jgi:hypothetical protein